MHQTMQESQQSGSGGNGVDHVMFNQGKVIGPKEGMNRVKYHDTEVERDEEQDQLNDIEKRVNVLKDVSINMNTDDQMDDDIHTVDKESGGNFTGNDLNNSLDLKDANRVTHDADIRVRDADDGPKMARNMGFPNMKYLDPDAQGPPIQEKTLYKEFQQNKDNDIKLQREGFSNPRQDMANNTFIKLFQASENPDKREELQSVQYAEQILDDDTSINEDTQIIVQKHGKKSGKYLNQNPPPQQNQNGHIEQSANKAKSKSLGKIGDHHV